MLLLIGFPDSWVGIESACNTGDPGSIPGSGRSSGEGKGYPLQYSDLENSIDCMGSQRVRHDWATFTIATTDNYYILYIYIYIYIYIYTCIYIISHFLYPFICQQTFRLFLCLSWWIMLKCAWQLFPLEVLISFIYVPRSVRTSSCFNSGVLSSLLCTMCSSLSAQFRDGLSLHPSLLQQGFLYDITNGDIKVNFKEPVCTCDLSIWQILIQYPGVLDTVFGSWDKLWTGLALEEFTLKCHSNKGPDRVGRVELGKRGWS